MAIDFYVGEVKSQSAAAKQMANEYSQFCGTLTDSVNAFMSAPLSSKTYDSAKLYFSAVYPSLASGFILACEALVEAHSKFPEEFQSAVDTCDVIEEQLKAEITQGQALLQNIARTMDKEKEPNQRTEQRYMGVQSSIQKNEEKLQKLYEFNASSPNLFADFEAQLANLEAGLAEVEKGAAWDPTSGTFDLSRVNLFWTKLIGNNWDKRQKKIDAVRQAEMQKEIGKLDGYEIVCIDYGKTKSWYIKKNGKWIYPGEESELYGILDQCKDFLKRDQYKVTQLKIVRNVAPLAIPGAPILENLIKAAKVTVGGAAAIVVGKGIIDQIKNAPSWQGTKKIEIEIPKNVERKIKKLSPEQKKALDKALDKLKNGDSTGLHDHGLKGDRKGERAIDIRGKGTGVNRGGGRVIYEKDKNGNIKLKDVITGHKY
ncbi:LXG domain-containing protein [Candidatus Enterococcus lemimoniae]|uniref:LXG domain-containing protein n=1 Tax=Candidatus Enterococcus lemimoniae TaxID=1834167 RepID=A0ABZ2TFI7_9ENTE|nr:LXG domain-containing protein [Enterococcus sp. 12C11_DIV0727]OTO69903.1 hypothetical protein A5866_002121 [Enterococcus sp. 12C11_DIV0727]